MKISPSLPLRRLLSRSPWQALAALAATGPLVTAQVTSDLDAIFVPEDRVPLSEFALSAAGTPTTLSVHDDVLDHALNTLGATIKIAYQATSANKETGPVSYLSGSGVAVDEVNDTVTFTTASSFRVVVVIDEWINDFPLVTHWSSTLNGGKGGHSPNATEGIGRIGWDSTLDDFVEEASIPVGTGTHNGHDLFHATETYWLFSDGSGETPWEQAYVPAYERYIAENWALFEVSGLAAIRLSDLAREWSGRPIAHLNPDPAFGVVSGGPVLQEDLPILQVVHAFIQEYEHPGQTGSEDQLASFIVPPYWTATPASGEEFTVYFSSAYDIYRSPFFSETAELWFRPIAELSSDHAPVSVVGIYTNGGGALASLSQQESVFQGTKELFDFAETNLGIDRTKVVATGGSRGGTAVIGMAGNPFADAFTAQYLVPGAPTTRPRDTVENHSNATHGLVEENTDILSGYVGSYQTREDLSGNPCFTAPSQLDPLVQLEGWELALETMYGVLDPEDENGTCQSNICSDFVDELALKGTRVILFSGTHDYAKPFTHMTEYYDALLGAAVPTRFVIANRAGHGGLSGTFPDMADLLRRTHEDSHGAFSGEQGIHYSHAVDNDDAVDRIGTSYSLGGTNPTTTPVFFEAPFHVAEGEEYSLTVVGPPGMQFELVSVYIDPVAWADCPPRAELQLTYTASGCPTQDMRMPLFSGTLPSSGNSEIAALSTTNRAPAPPQFGCISTGLYSSPYRILYLEYTLPGSNTIHVLTKNALVNGSPLEPADLGLPTRRSLIDAETECPTPILPGDQSFPPCGLTRYLNHAPVVYMGYSWPTCDTPTSAITWQDSYLGNGGATTDIAYD